MCGRDHYQRKAVNLDLIDTNFLSALLFLHATFTVKRDVLPNENLSHLLPAERLAAELSLPVSKTKVYHSWDLNTQPSPMCHRCDNY